MNIFKKHIDTGSVTAHFICLQGIRGNANWQNIKTYLDKYKAYRTITSDMIGIPVYTAVFILSTILSKYKVTRMDTMEKDICSLDVISDAYCGVTIDAGDVDIISYDGNIKRSVIIKHHHRPFAIV